MFFEHYDPERFASLYATVGPKLSQFFASPVIVALLEGSVKLRRPAVEAIEEHLLEYAKDDVKNQHVRQLVGHMIRHLMDELGYELDQPEVRLPAGVLFTCGARYRVAENAKRRLRCRASEAHSEAHKERRNMNERPISSEQLARWRREAEGLDKLADRGTDRRARVAVVDVDIVLSLLDEVERLRRELSVHANDGSLAAGPIPAATLQRWRAHAEQVSANDERWMLADRLLTAIQEVEGRRRGAAAALGLSAQP